MEVTEEKQGKTSLLRKWVDMVELRRLLALMLPLYIANLMHIGMGVIDTIVAGVAGPVELAAVALGTSVCAPIMVAVGAVLTIVGPMVSRMRGAGTERQIGLLLNNAKVLALILMVVEAGALYGGLYIFPLVTNDPVLAEKAAQYVWYMILGVPASVLLRAVGGYFEGYGQTRPAMVLSLGGLLLNVPLNYVLVLGKWGMPALGGAGCGLATAIIHWMMLAGLVLLMFVSGQHRQHARQMMAYRRPEWKWCGRIFHLGLPIGVASLCELGFFCVAMLIIAPLGELMVSAQQVAINVSGVIFMLPLSLGIAASIRAAYHVGAQRKAAFDAMVRTAVVVTYVLVILVMVMSILLRRDIVALYTDSEVVIDLAQKLILFCAIYQLPDATQALFSGVLRGCHDTRIITWINMVCYWLVGFPLAYLLVRTDYLVPAMGPAGAWVSFIVALTLAAILFLIRFARTRRKCFS
ncbi:MAG: MATE family efflux transporter [Akkermansia sp.]|nr:MATE family efflux transporter [Akkermansia sp.]